PRDDRVEVDGAGRLARLEPEEDLALLDVADPPARDLAVGDERLPHRLERLAEPLGLVRDAAEESGQGDSTGGGRADPRGVGGRRGIRRHAPVNPVYGRVKGPATRAIRRAPRTRCARRTPPTARTRVRGRPR